MTNKNKSQTLGAEIGNLFVQFFLSSGEKSRRGCAENSTLDQFPQDSVKSKFRLPSLPQQAEQMIRRAENSGNYTLADRHRAILKYVKGIAQ